MTRLLLHAAALAALTLGLTTPAASQSTTTPDRVELTNGDVLTGKVLAVTADTVKFNNAALGDVEIPIDEIVMLFSQEPVELQLGSGERIEGRVTGLDGGNLRVAVDSQERALPLADLVARTAPVAWSGSATVGGTYSNGNTERRGGTATANARRRTDDTRLSLNFFWIYQQEKVDADGAGPGTERKWNTSQRRTYGDAQFDYFLTKGLFAYVQGSLENDEFKDLELRSTIGAGLGYQLFDTDDFKLSIEGGLSYVDEQRYSGEDNSFLAARGGYSLDWQALEPLSVLSAGQIFPSLEDKDDVYARNDLRIRLKVNNDLFTQFQWILDWDNTPTAGNDRVDNQFFVAAGWSF